MAIEHDHAEQSRGQTPAGRHHEQPMSMGQHKPYRALAMMAGLSFVAMFLLMYAMVDSFGNIFPNLNQAYMAALMTAPMVLIELALMRRMYSNTRWNVIAVGASLAVGAASFAFIREQTAIGDDQFLRSMIPHHAGAILMCEKAQLSDAEIQRLCQSIIASQTAEIAQMKRIISARR